jgi:UDP-perosamine 4-acetyltransferase
MVLGGGGHAKVLISTLQILGIKVIGIVDADNTRVGEQVLGVPIVGNDDVLDAYEATSIRLVNGLGSVGETTLRESLYLKFKGKGFLFSQVVHPTSIIASDVCLGEGVQVMAGAVIQPGTVVGDNAIINTSVTIDHDCTIGEHVHLAPRVVLSGGVTIEPSVHIGTGAVSIQNIRIGKGSVVGAGSALVNNVPQYSKVVGVPGREILK